MLMTSANYGRMRTGRCLPESYDKTGKPHKMGCAEDIIRYFQFRFPKRVLQLGDIQGTVRGKPSCPDDICTLWTDESRQMCHTEVR